MTRREREICRTSRAYIVGEKPPDAAYYSRRRKRAEARRRAASRQQGVGPGREHYGRSSARLARRGGQDACVGYGHGAEMEARITLRRKALNAGACVGVFHRHYLTRRGETAQCAGAVVHNRGGDPEGDRSPKSSAG